MAAWKELRTRNYTRIATRSEEMSLEDWPFAMWCIKPREPRILGCALTLVMQTYNRRNLKDF
jgi:hypothetical protein